MPAMALSWRDAVIGTHRGDAAGFYEVIVEGWQTIPLRTDPAAAFNFAQAMKEGIDSFAEKAKYIFPDDIEIAPEALSEMFQTTNSILLGEAEVFTAEAGSLLDCLEEAGAALLEVLAV